MNEPPKASAQVGDITRGTSLHPRNLVVERPAEQTPDRLNAHICRFGKVPFAVAEYAHRFRAHSAHRKISEGLLRARCDRFRPRVLEHLASNVLRLRIELFEVRRGQILFAEPPVRADLWLVCDLPSSCG